MAGTQTNFAIPALPLDQAIVRLGQQASVSIGSDDPVIAVVIGNSVRGRMSVDRALRVLLDRTGFAFAKVDPQTYRIVRAATKIDTTPNFRKAPPARVRPSEHGPLPPALQPSVEPNPPQQDIIVTASKQGQSLADYPGTARVEHIGAIGLTNESGTAALVGRLPELNSTNLGPGRNKIFIRGVADSSFSGPTQSTVGLYLGELRLTYNAPNPDLRFYDIESIEVIEGPQGTLYGAGALSGIVRIIPNMPDATAFHAKASVGYATTASGRNSHDVGGTLNLPILADKIALRVVGYKQLLGGYIDNSLLGTRDTNRTQIEGARAALRIDVGNDWRIDLSGLLQNIDTRDGQYADRGLPALAHSAAITQPHDNDFRAVNLAVSKRWSNLELVSSTGIVHHDLSERFDATGTAGAVGVTAYVRDEHIRMFTHETRISSRGSSSGSWVAGVSYVSNIDGMGQAIGQPNAPVPLNLIRNEKNELAIFGEATAPVSSKWTVTGGARLVRAQTAGELLIGGTDVEPSRKQIRILPVLALSWKPTSDLRAFARLQSGFRSGGIAVDPAGEITKFESDQIYTGEFGLRFGKSGGTFSQKLSGSLSTFYSRWQDIQADLLDANGFPITANIGSGYIFGIEANVAWQPVKSLQIESAIFINRSALDSPAIELSGLGDSALPNVPRYGGRLSGRYAQPLSPRRTFSLDGTIRYRSGSSVGTVPPLLLEQGEYFEADVEVALDSIDWKLTLDVSNLFNAKENSFSFGNPFTASLGNQITPLRPRTIRLGINFGF